jgi:hypothetical protein
LIGCWGDDLVWATILPGVKTACIVVDCWSGAVCMGIPSVGCCSGAICTGISIIGCWADLWGGVGCGFWGGEGPIRRTREGGWMGADKNSSRRGCRLQQDERGFQHTTPTHYPSWPSPRSHWGDTRPRNQHTTFWAKTHQHAQQKLARLAACAAPVRPMACAG